MPIDSDWLNWSRVNSLTEINFICERLAHTSNIHYIVYGVVASSRTHSTEICKLRPNYKLINVLRMTWSKTTWFHDVFSLFLWRLRGKNHVRFHRNTLCEWEITIQHEIKRGRRGVCVCVTFTIQYSYLMCYDHVHYLRIIIFRIGKAFSSSVYISILWAYNVSVTQIHQDWLLNADDARNSSSNKNTKSHDLDYYHHDYYSFYFFWERINLAVRRSKQTSSDKLNIFLWIAIQ